ncbi:MAG: hypothetical protein PHI18_09630 [bacterium]|nr:hypothetical protein [bacterium]
MELTIRQDVAQPGWLLMKQDRDLLEAAERTDARRILRFYEWSEPTLSLGYHQSPDVLDRERLAQDHIPSVQRPTGGAAVLHSQELTYAIVIPVGEGFEAAATLLEGVSRAIAGALRTLGVAADVSPRGDPLTALKNRTSCFLRTSRWEVTVGGKKIVGSAQRRLTRAVLQHGSILTGDDHLRIVDYLKLPDEAARHLLRDRLKQHSTSLSAELGSPVDFTRLRQHLAQSFREVFAEFEPAVAGMIRGSGS